MRKRYFGKFIFRILVLVFVIAEYIIDPTPFEIMNGMSFFRSFSPLHIVWLIWMYEMIQQLIPARGVLTIGSQKQFLMHFMPSRIPKTAVEIKNFVASSNYANLKVFIIWTCFVVSIGLLKVYGIMETSHMLIVMAAMYVCDLICVLFWCPFRVYIMKNRCCATCNIFNWDHIMMFSPGAFVMGFFTWSLFLMSVAVFIVWEVYFFTHPERFWEETNDALKCSNCTEELCGRKLHVKP